MAGTVLPTVGGEGGGGVDQDVELVRTGPGLLSPFALPGWDRFFNTTEYVVHHEDVRRAQPDWAPRTMPRQDQDALWAAAGLYARRGGGRRGVVLRRSDVAGQERRIGAAGRTVEGEPLELLLWAAGRRDVARVSVT